MNLLQLVFHGHQLDGGRSRMWLRDWMREPRLEAHVLRYRSCTVARRTHMHENNIGIHRFSFVCVEYSAPHTDPTVNFPSHVICFHMPAKTLPFHPSQAILLRLRLPPVSLNQYKMLE